MLITRFMTPAGVGEVLDFMPVTEGEPTDRHRLVRHLRVARGSMRFVIDIQQRSDNGRAEHAVEMPDAGAVFRSDGTEFILNTAGQRTASEGGAAWERVGDGLRVVFTMRSRRERPRCRDRIRGKPASGAASGRARPAGRGYRGVSGRVGCAARPIRAGGGRW